MVEALFRMPLLPIDKGEVLYDPIASRFIAEKGVLRENSAEITKTGLVHTTQLSPDLWSALTKSGTDQNLVTSLINLGLLTHVSTAPALLRKSGGAQLYINLTDGCNFSCPGCAVQIDEQKQRNSHSSTQYMSESTLDNVLWLQATEAKRLGVKNPSVKFAGGEPLLPEALKRLVHGAETIQEIYEQSGVKITPKILTNGVMIPESIDELRKINQTTGVFVSVSSWGRLEESAASRGGNQKSTVKILEGLRLLAENRIPFGIHVTITPQNAHQMAQIVSEMLDRDQPIPTSFALWRPSTPEQQTMIEKSDGYERMVTGVKEGIDAIKDLVGRGVKLPYFTFDNNYHPGRATNTVCSAGAGYAGISADGAVSPCHSIQGQDKPDGHNIFGQWPELMTALDCTTIEKPDEIDSLALWYAIVFHGGLGCPTTWSPGLNQKPSLEYAIRVAAPLIPESLSLLFLQQTSQSN